MGWQLLADAIADRAETARRILRDAMVLEGSERVRVKTDGLDFGTATVGPGRSTVLVNDAVLLAWVQKNRPDQVQTLVRVHPSFVEYLKKQALKEGAACDLTTGEVIPGIEVVSAGGYVLSIRPTPEVRVKTREFVERTVTIGDIAAIGSA